MISVYIAFAVLVLIAVHPFTRGYYYQEYVKRKKKVVKNTGCGTCAYGYVDRCASNPTTIHHPISGPKEVDAFCVIKNLGCECTEWEVK